MKKSYEAMSKAELLKIALIYGIKNRHKMKKDELINSIEKAKKPLKAIREVETSLNKSLKDKYNIIHLEFMPKDPGYAFLSWEVPGYENLKLKISSQKEDFISLPISGYGKGYFKVPEGSNLKAVIGKEIKDKFRVVASSPEISIPVSKPHSSMNSVWIDVRKLKANKKKISETEEMRKQRKETEKLAKKIKYLRLDRSDK